MPVVSPGTNRASEMEALIEQGDRLPLGAFVGVLLACQGFDLADQVLGLARWLGSGILFVHNWVPDARLSCLHAYDT
jgi:hypothetical protein